MAELSEYIILASTETLQTLGITDALTQTAETPLAAPGTAAVWMVELQSTRVLQLATGGTRGESKTYKEEVISNNSILPQTTLKQLEKVSAVSRRTTGAIKHPVAEMLEYDEWVIEQIDAGLADEKAGRVLSDEAFWKQMGKSGYGRKRLLEWSIRSSANVADMTCELGVTRHPYLIVYRLPLRIQNSKQDKARTKNYDAAYVGYVRSNFL